ncbi:MAG: hypothetical protein QXR45_12250, partial [Candidatus Bathyarchaeia archaeon]
MGDLIHPRKINRNRLRLGSSRNLVIELGDDGLIKSIVSYIEPRCYVEAKVTDSFSTQNLKLKSIEEPKYEPTMLLTREGLIADDWVEKLSGESPFPILEGMHGSIFECVWEADGEEIKRTIRAIPGIEMGTIALDVSFETQLSGLRWEFKIEGDKGIRVIKGCDGHVKVLDEGSFLIPRGNSSIRIYLISIPRKSIVDRELMVLVPKKALSEINLKICAGTLLRSIRKGKYAPIIAYDEEEIINGLELSRIERFIRRIMPSEIGVSLIGLDSSLVESIKKEIDRVFEKFKGVKIRFLERENEAQEALAQLGLDEKSDPIKELKRRANERREEKNNEAVLIDAVSSNGGKDELLEILGYGYAALKGARLFEISKKDLEENISKKKQVTKFISAIDILMRARPNIMTSSEKKILEDVFRSINLYEEFSRYLQTIPYGGEKVYFLFGKCLTPEKILQEWLSNLRKELINIVDGLLGDTLGDLGLSSIEIIHIFADADIPYDLSSALRSKAVGFVPIGAADRILLSCLLTEERSISPVPSIIIFDPQVDICRSNSDKLWEEVNKLWEKKLKKSGLLLRLKREAANPYPMFALLNNFGCDIFLALTHGIYDYEKGEVLFLCGPSLLRAGLVYNLHQSDIKRYLSPERHTFFVITACGSWRIFAEAISSGMRGAVVARWTVLANDAVEASIQLLKYLLGGCPLGKALAKAKSTRNDKTNNILSAFSREAFFLVGLPSLSLKFPHENARSDLRARSDILSELILSMRAPKEYAMDMLAALEEADSVIFEELKIIEEELKGSMLVELGNSYEGASPSKAGLEYAASIIIKNNKYEAWNNSGYTSYLSSLICPALLEYAASIIIKNNKYEA